MGSRRVKRVGSGQWAREESAECWVLSEEKKVGSLQLAVGSGQLKRR